MLCRIGEINFFTLSSEGALRNDDGAGFDPKAFLAEVGEGLSTRAYTAEQTVFAQGSPADAVFYLQRGKIKLSLLSPHGKEAVIALLGATDFFGEGCLAGQRVRMASATAIAPCTIVRVEQRAMIRALADRREFAGAFIAHLLSRNIRIEEDLADQLFNSSEKRLARLLLLLANFGKEGVPEPAIPKLSQQTLADMIGTTRSRVSFFMNKFRRLGFIEYEGSLHVNSSLLNVILHE
ncbi:MAG: family transcriptional regulator, cyclic receptor protein [Candidatus Eremiobacteraeota bacterium]|nr:family transcriptional regulator, cyclic receptor protein [Candidatus Eremiobacteraeota bacterium]